MNKDVHEYGTRFRSHLEQHRLRKLKMLSSEARVALLDKLSERLKTIQNYNDFKNTQRQLLFSGSFYSVDVPQEMLGTLLLRLCYLLYVIDVIFIVILDILES